jgi:hypothetical protein
MPAHPKASSCAGPVRRLARVLGGVQARLGPALRGRAWVVLHSPVQGAAYSGAQVLPLPPSLSESSPEWLRVRRSGQPSVGPDPGLTRSG